MASFCEEKSAQRTVFTESAVAGVLRQSRRSFLFFNPPGGPTIDAHGPARHEVPRLHLLTRSNGGPRNSHRPDVTRKMRTALRPHFQTRFHLQISDRQVRNAQREGRQKKTPQSEKEGPTNYQRPPLRPAFGVRSVAPRSKPQHGPETETKQGKRNRKETRCDVK